MYFLYSFCFTLAFIIALPYFLVRGIWQKKYFSNFGQRLGWLSIAGERIEGSIWIHAVSVGEVLSSLEFLRQVKLQCPRSPVFVSTTTLAGRATAGEKLSELADGVFFAPVDYVWAVRRVLRTRASRPSGIGH